MNLVYRPYSEKDFEQCIALISATWEMLPENINTPETQRLLAQGYFELCLCASDYTQICERDSKVAGFILGLTDKNSYNREKRKKGLKLLWNLIIGKYGKFKGRLGYLNSMMKTNAQVESICRDFDSEVMLFIVDSNFRGKGIGRELMNHLVDYARNNGKKSVYLYTDIRSNRKFYEIYGFTKLADFHDYHLSYVLGKKTMSFIYKIDL